MTVSCPLHCACPLPPVLRLKHGGRRPDFTDFWCNPVDVICLDFKTYRDVLLFLSPSSLAGGMRFAAVGLDK